MVLKLEINGTTINLEATENQFTIRAEKAGEVFQEVSIPLDADNTEIQGQTEEENTFNEPTFGDEGQSVQDAQNDFLTNGEQTNVQGQPVQTQIQVDPVQVQPAPVQAQQPAQAQTQYPTYENKENTEDEKVNETKYDFKLKTFSEFMESLK